jgi:cytochrome c553
MNKLSAAVLTAVLLGAGLSARSAGRVDGQAQAGPSPVASHDAAPLAVEAQNTLVATYCATCHSDRGKAGNLSLQGFDATQAVEHAEVVEKMIRKLRAGMMPPANARRPDEASLAALVDALETRIDRAAAANPSPGWRPFQRLNRAEYASAVRELLDLDADVAPYLPPDTISHGFDNVADVQSFSPALMEGYLRAASQISRLAVGDRNASATTVTYELGRSASQVRRVDGAPMGTRGGVSVVHTFPADGDYVFRISLHNEPLGGLFGRTTMSTMKLDQRIEVSINGERVALFTLNPRMSETTPDNSLELETAPIHVKAGPQRVTAAFLEDLIGPADDLLMPLENTLADVSISFGVTTLPHMRDMAVIGPRHVTGVSDTPSRRRIFTCRPMAPGEEEACAGEIARRLATAAYRRPATEADVAELMAFYEQGRAMGGFEAGVRLALQAMLASPQFVFRFEDAPAAAPTATAYRLGDTELASRLSFFLWGAPPDDELLDLAASRTLSTPATLERQVRRLLADPRSRALATRFAAQWLRLQDLDKISPDYLLYPQYDATLAAAMRKETELFFDSLVREDRSVLDLLTADYSFVNERLAVHYGIPNVTGSRFRRVTLPESRRGLLGHGSILTLTSVADRTSPVLRGKWVMEVLLGSPPPPPPPNVPSLDDSVKSAQGGRRLSTRERMEEHRRNPACTSCHRVIDPLGLALENFDVTGAWRIKDNEVPVDVAGELYDGTRFEGPEGLRDALLKRRDVVLMAFTESLMTYALGRRVEHFDLPTVRAIVRKAEARDYRLSSLILGVVDSPAFRMSAAEAPDTTMDETPARPAAR